MFNSAYDKINQSIKRGIERYIETVPTRRGEVRRLMYHNLVVKNGMVRKEAKPLPPKFCSYEQYRNYLTAAIAGMGKNAKSNARVIPLRILSTQSRGYDTTAINAVARDHGLDLALSIGEVKERDQIFKPTAEKHNQSDSGEDIARCLGIDFRLIDRRFFQGIPVANIYIGLACISVRI